MNKSEFLELMKQHSNETLFLSFTKRDHPAYIKLMAAGEEIVPWLLERLRDSIGHDHGDDMDTDNNPWLSTHLLGEITAGVCWDGFPSEHAGKLNEVRNYLLKWGENKNAK